MSDYKICKNCVMDTSDPSITFNAEGICCYCEQAMPMLEKLKFTEEESKRKLELLAAEVKKRKPKKSPYDCVMGISGGVDSSYLAYVLKEKMGLNPLVVHFDNGWNSDQSVKNIKNIIDKLHLDLHTYVINWPEFRDLQRAFFKASVLDIELLTDNAIYATMFKIAKEYGIKCIASGSNIATETGMPETWSWFKFDTKNIKNIHKKFGEKKLKTFPMFSIWKNIFYRLSRKFYFFTPLDYINYNKTEAIAFMEKNLGWAYYGGKHYESQFTKFYQAYILPKKFGIDKRRVHLSSLIRNAEITRDEALVELDKPLYELAQLNIEREYIAKKLGFSVEELEKYISKSGISHSEYGTSKKVMDLALKMNRLLKKIRKVD